MQRIPDKLKTEDTVRIKSANENQSPGGPFFNILPFERLGEPVPVVFTTRKDRNKHRFSTERLPRSFQQNFKDENGEIPEFVYTGFNGDKQGITINIDWESFPAVAKAWYTHKIRELLAPKTAYHRTNFLNDTQFWYPNESGDTAHWNSFHKCTLRVQSDFITSQPELLISYDGCSYIGKMSLEAMNEDGALDTRPIKTVAFRKKIYQIADVPEEALYARNELFPVINREIATQLGLQFPFSLITDKFNLIYRQMEWFYTRFCADDSFTEIIPHKGQWKPVAAELTGRINVSEKKLVFGQENTNVDAFKGMKEWGPLKLPPGTHFSYFFIYFDHQEDAALTLYRYLLKKEGFLKMNDFTHLPLRYEKNKKLVIQQGEDPEIKVTEFIQNTFFDPAEVYFAFYISPYTKHETDDQKKKLYYHIKEMLLYRKISMQTVESHKLTGNFGNSMANIGIALVAKLGGIPWRLEGMKNPELVIGFGAYRNQGFTMGYTGSAICFSQDGVFREFDVFPAENTRSIAGSALKAFKEYRKAYPEAQRMIIHFYKPMSRRELEPLENMLREIKLDIPVIIAGITKTPSKRLLLFDDPKKNTMPVNGTWAKIAKSTYLLNINLRKHGYEKNVKQTLPLRITLQCNREGYLEQDGVVLELLEQIYAFSFLHWRSVRQAPLPVTVKYPSLIASFMPWFSKNFLPPFGKTRPWFL